MKYRSSILLIVILAVVSFASISWAGGGINYTIKVHNPLDSKIRVKAYKRRVDLDHTPVDESWRVIHKGGAHAFETGALCPAFVEGEYFHDGQWVKMRYINCLGKDFTTAAGTDIEYASTCCWTVIFKACRKTGNSKTDDVQDFDFGFCKN